MVRSQQEKPPQGDFRFRKMSELDQRGAQTVARFGQTRLELKRAAKARGIEGTIVDGAARDVDESREIGYAVFARDAVPTTARGRIS